MTDTYQVGGCWVWGVGCGVWVLGMGCGCLGWVCLLCVVCGVVCLSCVWRAGDNRYNFDGRRHF